MDLKWPRVARRSNVGLVLICEKNIKRAGVVSAPLSGWFLYMLKQVTVPQTFDKLETDICCVVSHGSWTFPVDIPKILFQSDCLEFRRCFVQSTVLHAPGQTPPFQHCLHMRNLDSDLDYLFIFRCKPSQLLDTQGHVNMACNQWLGTWDVAIIYTGGDKDLCHCSMDVSWLDDIVPCKIKSNLNCRCQLTFDDLGIRNTKLKYCQCTSAALLCCENTQLSNCMWQIITHDWWIWMVLLIPHCYKTRLLPPKGS